MDARTAPTLSQLFHSQAAHYGPRAFLRERTDGKWIDHSWSEIAAASRRLQTGLARIGLGRGDRIAILADNCPQWVVVDQAALGLGAVVVPLYPTSSSEEIGHIVRDSGSRVIAVRGPEHLRKLSAICATIPTVAALIAIHPQAAPASGKPTILTLPQLSEGPEAPPREGRRDELATIIYTSGTTGASKGVMLTHGNLLSNCEAALAALQLNDRDETLSFLPMAHSFERTAGYYTVMAGGGTIAYAEGLGQIAANLLQINPTVVLTVPRLLEVIHDRIVRTLDKAPGWRRALFAQALRIGARAAAYHFRGAPVPLYQRVQMAPMRALVLKRIRALFGNRLRYLIAGGAPLSKDIFEFFSAAELPLVEGYGLTEAAPVVAVNLLGQTRPGTVGRPLAGIEVRLAGDGELLIHGPNVMQGYFNLPADSREAIDEQGWLHSGDIATIDADGYIAIRDRKKEIIVLSGGKNVSPAALEAKLLADPSIAQACVVGDRRKHPAALLVPRFERLEEFARQQGLGDRSHQELLEEPLVRDWYHQRMRQINRQLGDYERLGSFMLIATPFTQERGELTPTLKLRRKAIVEHYRREIDQMYEG
ncbi:MAG TPA: long-chain fatty acid--CoA ligase [Candidatus Binataceae bacterium]|nr:long-chain fatty acid--CoA ligase [Candidatus Binataceae bacterium]